MNKSAELTGNKDQELVANSKEELIPLLIDSIQDIKAKDVVLLDLRAIDESPTDYFIVCSGESSTQVRAIAENIKKRVKDELGILPYKAEGMMGAKWILVDYFDIVIHVFYKETREFYELEDLWGDAIFKHFEDIA